jgi:hypothetical protein
MTRVRGRRNALLAALAIVVVWWGVEAWRRASRETLVLATTTCPFSGEPVVTISAAVVPQDSEPVRAHEEVHAAQCRQLGPWRYRWTNLRGAGKLGLEAPAYCAGAAVRLRAGQDSGRVRLRLIENAYEALAGLADSTAIRRSLQAACPTIIAAPAG